MSIKISRVEDKLIITFPYSPERICKIKSIRGYSWNPDKKEWSIPYLVENINSLRNLFKNEQIAVDFIYNENNEKLFRLVEEQLKRFSSFIAKDFRCP